MRGALPLAALAAVAALSACVPAPVGSTLAARPDDAPRVEDPVYYEFLNRYTRQGSVYDGLDQRLFAAVTWQAWPFRQQRVDAVARFLSLQPAERAAMIAQEQADARSYNDFFVGFYTNQTSWNDLQSRKSIWRIELQPEGGAAILPIQIERIDRPDPNVAALYPYLTPFWVGYRVRFPAEDERGRSLFPQGSPRMTVRFSSAVGRLELVFSLLGQERPPLEILTPEGPAPAPSPP